MILRFLMTMTGVIFCAIKVNCIYATNCFFAFFPLEGNRNSIFILSTQVILTLSAVVLIPVILLGNDCIKIWLPKGSKFKFSFVITLLAASYISFALLMVTFFSQNIDMHLRTVSSSFIPLILFAVYFLISDIKWALKIKL
jgi:hypothetical protein